MAVGDLTAFTIDANGERGTCVAEGLTAGSLVEDVAKRPVFTVVSLGFDAAGVANTASRTIHARFISAAGSPNPTITFELIHAPGSERDGATIYSKDKTGVGNSGTDPLVSVVAGWLTGSNAVTAAAVTNNSTTPYPKAIVGLDTVPHQRWVGTATARIGAYHRHGLARVQCTLEDAAAASLAKSAPLTLVPRNRFGRAAQYPVYVATFDLATENGGSNFAVGAGHMDWKVYPRVGDAAAVYDTTTSTVSPKRTTHTECFLDWNDTEAAKQLTAWVDSTADVALTGKTGTFTAWEYARCGTSDAVLIVVADEGATLRFNQPQNKTYAVVLRSVTGTIPSGVTIQGGTIGTQVSRQGRVIRYIAGTQTLEYERFEDAGELVLDDPIFFFDRTLAPPPHPTVTPGDAWGAGDVTGTAVVDGTPVAIGDAASPFVQSVAIVSGETITGMASGATASASGTQANNGSNTTGAVGNPALPYRTIQKAFVGIRNARGDSRADGGIAKLYSGEYRIGPRVFADRFVTADYWAMITRDDAASIDDVRIIRSAISTTDPDATGQGTQSNFVGLRGIRIEIKNVNGTLRTQSGAETGGITTSRPSMWVDQCNVIGFGGIIQSAALSGSSWTGNEVHYTGYYAEHCQRSHPSDGQSGVMNGLYLKNGSGDQFRSPRSIINSQAERMGADGTAIHSDNMQFVGDHRYNVYAWGLEMIGCIRGQLGPFSNGLGTAIWRDSAFIAMLQDDNLDRALTNSAQFGAMAELTNINVIHCTFGDSGPSHSDVTGIGTIYNITYRNCIFKAWSQTQGTPRHAAWFNECHFEGTRPASGDGSNTDAATYSSIYARYANPTDVALSDYLKPKAGGPLVARLSASQVIDGVAAYDVTGTPIVAGGEVGALQGAAGEPVRILVDPLLEAFMGNTIAIGNRWMTVNSTSVQWPPVAGAGGAHVGDPVPEADRVRRGVLLGFRVLTSHTADTVITVYQADGTTVVTTIPVVANTAKGQFLPVGNLQCNNGISAKTSDVNTTGELVYIQQVP